jgi:TonB family protein
LTVGRDGKLVDARIAQSSGSMAPDRAALAAKRQSTYEPKMEAVPIRRQAGTGAVQNSTGAGMVCRAVIGKYFFKVTFRPY